MGIKCNDSEFFENFSEKKEDIAYMHLTAVRPELRYLGM